MPSSPFERGAPKVDWTKRLGRAGRGLLLLLAATGVGCGRGWDELPDCTTGVNMANPRLGGQPVPEGPELHRLLIHWDAPGGLAAGLPARYFESVRIGRRGTPGLIRQVALTGERELTVWVTRLYPTIADGRSLSFSLEFPDRRDYVECQHRGMPDIYVLQVTLRLAPDDRTVVAILIESIVLGAI